MRFVVLGAGAIGGSVGGRLACAGHDVAFVSRGPHGAAIAERGLVLEAPDGTRVVHAWTVARVQDIAWRGGDVVLLAIKTQDAPAALAELAACAPPDTPIACLTNGLEAERIAARWFGDVHAVCVMSPAEHVEPGIVRQWGAPLRGVLDVGRFPRGTDVLDDSLAKAFVGAGYAAEPRADVLAWKRTKLLLNLGNVLEALCGPAARGSELAAAARAEGSAVLEAAGLPRVSDEAEAARRALVVTAPIAGQARRGGSTWQSLARGRSLETDYLNGEIVALGRIHGVPTPVNEKLQRAGAEAARAGRIPGTLPLAELIA